MSDTFTIKQGDTLPPLRAQLLGPDGGPVDIAGADVTFCMSGRISAPAVIEHAGEGRVRYDWRPGDTDAPGVRSAEFVVMFVGGAIQRVPNGGYMTVRIAHAVCGGGNDG